MKTIKSHSIFFGLALTGILVLSILAYLTKRQLIGETSSRVNIELFYHYNHYLTTCNNIIFIVLLFIANLMFISQRYWDTFIWTGLIFLAFTLIDWWWLSEIAFHYKVKNELWEGESNLYPFFGIIIAMFGLFVAVLNYLLLKRIYKEKVVVNVEHDLKDSIDKKDL